MKDKSFLKLIAKSMSVGLIPILVIVVIFVILALIDTGFLILIPFVVVPVLIVVVPLIVIGYAIYKGRGRQRFVVPVVAGLILFVGSFWIFPTNVMWKKFFDGKSLEEATPESCAKISQVHKKTCYGLAGKKSGNLKICDHLDMEESRVCYQGIYHLIADADLCSSIDMKIHRRLKGLSFSAAECIGRSKKDKAWQEACQRISQLPEESRKSVMEKALCPSP